MTERKRSGMDSRIRLGLMPLKTIHRDFVGKKKA